MDDDLDMVLGFVGNISDRSVIPQASNEQELAETTEGLYQTDFDPGRRGFASAGRSLTKLSMALSVAPDP